MENNKHHHSPPPNGFDQNQYDSRHTCKLTLNMRTENKHTLKLETPVAQAVVGDYRQLTNKPRINGVELVGNVSLEDIGIPDLSGVPRIPLSIYDLDIITDCASTEASFLELCSDGGEVSLFNDITLTQPVTVVSDLTLDLHGNTINSTLDEYLFTVDSCVMTIKNGTISTEGSIATVINGGELIIDDGNYVSKNIVFSVPDDDSSIVINNGTIKSLNSFSIYSSKVSNNNTIVLNNGDLESNIITNGYESCCIYIAGKDTFTMNGGTVKSTDGCGILMRAGTVSINDGEIIALKKENSSHSPGYIDKENKLMSATAIIYDEASDFPSKDDMSLTISDGTFTGADHAIEILSNEVIPAVYVTGGTFIPDFPE